jgi:hypothetical protein
MHRGGADAREEAVLKIAHQKGLIWGGVGVLTGAGVIYGLTQKVPNFNKRIGKSAMAGLPIMCGIFAWNVAVEQTIFYASQSPEDYGLEKRADQKFYYLPVWKSLMNQFLGKNVKTFTMVSSIHNIQAILMLAFSF